MRLKDRSDRCVAGITHLGDLYCHCFRKAAPRVHRLAIFISLDLFIQQAETNRPFHFQKVLLKL